MELLRSHIAYRCLWLLLALQILNCSVDTPDAQPDGQAEDLSINDMETIAEVILEQVLGIENAFPEHDEPDDQGGFVKKVIDQLYTPKLALLEIIDLAPVQVHDPSRPLGWVGLCRPEPSVQPPKEQC